MLPGQRLPSGHSSTRMSRPLGRSAPGSATVPALKHLTLQVDDTPPEEGTGETEEECQAEFRPLVQLDEVEKESGEEGETALINM